MHVETKHTNIQCANRFLLPHIVVIQFDYTNTNTKENFKF